MLRRNEEQQGRNLSVYIDWERGYLLHELAERYNLSFERVRQIVKREQARMISRHHR